MRIRPEAGVPAIATLAALTFGALSCAERAGTEPSGSRAPGRDARATAGDAAAREGRAAASASSDGAGTSRAKFDDYVVSGPYGHANLAVYLVHGRDRIKGKEFLTLEEALERKKVSVHETGNVNELAIENISLTEEVYVQSGDIVKGGKQDRVIAHDFIVPAKSGKMPIASFCVERGRWRQRGGESVAAFSESNAQLATKALKFAAKKAGSQQEVWREVANAQRLLAANVTVSGGDPAVEGGAGPDAAGDTPAAVQQIRDELAARRQEIVAFDVQGGAVRIIEPSRPRPASSGVQSASSPTSLQLTLENEKVREAAAKYVAALGKIVEGEGDVVGFAFAINGKANSADVYASSALFRKLWPKLLKASAVEAVAELRKGEKVEHPSPGKLVADFLAKLDEEGEAGEVSEKRITKRVRMVTREADDITRWDTHDAASPAAAGEAIHSNWLAH